MDEKQLNLFASVSEYRGVIRSGGAPMNDKELLPWLEKMLTGDEAAFRVVYQATHTDDYQDENGVMHEDRLDC